ncbi:hypothetical protein HOLleu_03054 [Holothuria leucospilota]|uniref:DUF6729 domain-containing protein n=1 Tax=Holothuria leucospilota TaxID=206669 RepID=A0A9Q1CSJ5_HOLLE|nr:hypothetical protein HOLleu_03054 [Holothuria leucospilota]
MPGPNVRLTKSGEVVMKATPAAEQAKQVYKGRPAILPQPPVHSPEDVEKRARQRLASSGLVDPDAITLLGEFEIKRGQYRGKTFKWLLENDPAYGLYLWREHEKGPSPGKTIQEGERVTANVSSLVSYIRMVPVCVHAHQFIVTGLQARQKAKETGDEGYNKVGFGRFRDLTYTDLYQSTDREHQRYCKWLLSKTDVTAGSSMHRLKMYLQRLQSSSTSGVPGPDQPCVSNQDTTPQRTPPIDSTITQDTSQGTGAPDNVTTLKVTNSNSWKRFVSPAQERWMREELQKLGLLPGTAEYLQEWRWRGQPMWRTPPPGELQMRPPSQLPKPDYFWLHPMFVWSPEKMCAPLLGNVKIPCITPACRERGESRVERRGIGKPRVVVGIGGGSSGLPNTGQYYILASTLYCSRCKCSPWASDQLSYLQLLPKSLQNLFPAVVTYRKAVCKSLVDHIRRPGQSPADAAKEIEELLQLRFERAHAQYLLLLKTVREQARSGATLDAASGLDTTESCTSFGEYGDFTGYRGVSVSQQFLANVLISEYQEQKPYLHGLLKGVFGKYWRSDHTRTLAKKVELLSGTMWSFCTFNEFWEVVSWVMVDSDSEMSLTPYYQGLSRRYEMAGVDKAAVRWIDKWCCVAPPYTCSAYPRFMSLLSSAVFIIDEQDLKNLRAARAAIGAKGEPTKKEIRKHCR